MIEQKSYDILKNRKVRDTKAAYPPRRSTPSRQKKGGMPMYVTYPDLIQIGIFIVTLVGLCYTVFGRKK